MFINKIAKHSITNVRNRFITERAMVFLIRAYNFLYKIQNHLYFCDLLLLNLYLLALLAMNMLIKGILYEKHNLS